MHGDAAAAVKNAMLREALQLAATCAALAVFATPLQTAKKIQEEKCVGPLTPLPCAVRVANASNASMRSGGGGRTR